MKLQTKTISRGWVTMAIFWVGYALCQVLVSGIGLMLPDMSTELNLTSAQAGTLGAIGWILAALVTVPLSAWITRFPPKPIIAIAFGGLILIHLVSAWSPSYNILLVARGLGSLMVMSTLSVIVLMQNQWFLPTQMGTVKGIETGLVSLGQMATLAGLPFLMASLSGWRGTYILAGVAFIPVLVGWIFLAREKRTPDHQPRTVEQPEASAPIVSVLKHKEFLLLGIGSAGASVAYVAIMSFWPTYATQVRGVSLETAGLILSLVAVGSMVASFIAGVLSDKIGWRKPIPIIAGMLMPVAYFMMLKFSSTAALGAIAFLIGFGACVSVPIILAIPFEIQGIKPREIAVGIGFITALTNIGAALGSQLTGFLIGGLGLYATLVAVCLSPLMLSVCIFLCTETGPRAKAREVYAT